MRQLTIETVFVVALFLLYSFLWAIKRRSQKRSTGADPEVFSESRSSLQRYMKTVFNVIRAYAVAIIVLHAVGLQFYALFTRFQPIGSLSWKLSGFGVGLLGLSLCLYGQVKMGNSWRVGIDEETKTDLVTTGLYRFARNPTYLGLFLLNLGVWLIWPTITIFILNLLFVYTLDVQVRCEEDFLEKRFGDKYRVYMRGTKRYVPFVY